MTKLTHNKITTATKQFLAQGSLIKQLPPAENYSRAIITVCMTFSNISSKYRYARSVTDGWEIHLDEDFAQDLRSFL